MRRLLLLLVATFVLGLSSNEAKAQDYSDAIGLRLGWPVGATYKHLFGGGHGIEAMFGYDYGGDLSVLYEYHIEIPQVPGLRPIVGAGLDFQFDHRFFGFGVDPIVGLDYKFSNAPINLTVDWRPTILLAPHVSFWAGFAALSVRYTIK